MLPAILPQLESGSPVFPPAALSPIMQGRFLPEVDSNSAQGLTPANLQPQPPAATGKTAFT